MIYLDSSAALARVFAETRSPNEEVWQQDLVSSRLLLYEVWNRIHVRGAGRFHTREAERLIGRISFSELAPEVLSRALQPFAVPVRTLDGLHLATMDFLRARGQAVELLSYDTRMLAAAQAMGIPAYGE